MEKENKKVSLDTMTGVGKKVTLAGREYTILPVNISDMHYIIGSGIEPIEGEIPEKKLIIVDKKTITEDDNSTWQIFGLNIVDKDIKKIFIKMLNKYVYYKDYQMTEELLIEHGWSFKEIGQFLYYWAQISD